MVTQLKDLASRLGSSSTKGLQLEAFTGLEGDISWREFKGKFLSRCRVVGTAAAFDHSYRTRYEVIKDSTESADQAGSGGNAED